MFLRRDENVFNKIHCMLLNDAFDIWMICKKRWATITIMEFKITMDKVKEKFIQATKDVIFEEFSSLEARYKTLPNDLVRKDIRIM